jgi:hypothetical protein
MPLLLTTADSIVDQEIEQTLALVAGQSDIVEGALRASSAKPSSFKRTL